MDEDAKRNAAQDIAELLLERVERELCEGRASYGASEGDIDDIWRLVHGARVVIE
jgi:hypothetical protein